MITRRFGKTNLNMPVLTMGGMRFQKSWQDARPEDIEAAEQENVKNILHHALANGINHIETARGYGSSEFQLGKCLVDIPREKYILQTKVGPEASEEAFKKNFELSMELLGVSHVELLSMHGVNDEETLSNSLKYCLPLLRKYQEQGVVKNIGFSTHGPRDVINKAIDTDEFSYVNLHYYYIDQSKHSCVENATKRDMGVFIISPNDKGGMLYKPTPSLCATTKPFSPMEFNNLFCLLDQRVHTLSIGASKPEDFDHHLQSLELLDSQKERFEEVKAKVDAVLENALSKETRDHIDTLYENPYTNAEEINIHVISRLWALQKAFEMQEYGKMRYNLLGNGGHWFPGQQLDIDKRDKVLEFLKKDPFKDVIMNCLEESIDLFKGEDKKRLSES